MLRRSHLHFSPLRTLFGACVGSSISVGADTPETEKHNRADSGSRDHDEQRKPPAAKRLRKVAADLARDGRPDIGEEGDEADGRTGEVLGRDVGRRDARQRLGPVQTESAQTKRRRPGDPCGQEPERRQQPRRERHQKHAQTRRPPAEEPIRRPAREQHPGDSRELEEHYHGSRLARVEALRLLKHRRAPVRDKRPGGIYREVYYSQNRKGGQQ